MTLQKGAKMEQLLKKLGYEPIGGRQSVPISLWKSWYEGKVNAFHEYRQYNGKRLLRRTRKSLCMAKRICEDWADLIYNEKVDIKAEEPQVQQTLDRVFFENNFRVYANRLIEQTFALGTGAFVEHKGKDFALV